MQRRKPTEWAQNGFFVENATVVLVRNVKESVGRHGDAAFLREMIGLECLPAIMSWQADSISSRLKEGLHTSLSCCTYPGAPASEDS